MISDENKDSNKARIGMRTIVAFQFVNMSAIDGSS